METTSEGMTSKEISDRLESLVDWCEESGFHTDYDLEWSLLEFIDDMGPHWIIYPEKPSGIDDSGRLHLTISPGMTTEYVPPVEVEPPTEQIAEFIGELKRRRYTRREGFPKAELRSLSAWLGTQGYVL